MWNSRIYRKLSIPGDSEPLFRAIFTVIYSNRYNVVYFHCEEFLESMVALKERDYDKYARKMKKYLK